MMAGILSSQGQAPHTAVLLSCQIVGERFLQKLHAENGQRLLVAIHAHWGSTCIHGLAPKSNDVLCWGCLFFSQKTQNIDIAYHCLLHTTTGGLSSILPTSRLHKSTKAVLINELAIIGVNDVIVKGQVEIESNTICMKSERIMVRKSWICATYC